MSKDTVSTSYPSDVYSLNGRSAAQRAQNEQLYAEALPGPAACDTRCPPPGDPSSARARQWNEASNASKNQALQLNQDGSYTVREGDCLSTIAARELRMSGQAVNGKSIAAEIERIRELNKDQHQTLANCVDIKGGWHLRLSGAERAPQTVEQTPAPARARVPEYSQPLQPVESAAPRPPAHCRNAEYVPQNRPPQTEFNPLAPLAELGHFLEGLFSPHYERPPVAYGRPIHGGRPYYAAVQPQPPVDYGYQNNNYGYNYADTYPVAPGYPVIGVPIIAGPIVVPLGRHGGWHRGHG